MSIPTRKELIEINKEFHNGSVRNESELDFYYFILDLWSNKKIIYHRQEILEVAKRIAMRHPFIDGNKRTALKYAEKKLGEKVPEWVYWILDF